MSADPAFIPEPVELAHAERHLNAARAEWQAICDASWALYKLGVEAL